MHSLRVCQTFCVRVCHTFCGFSSASVSQFFAFVMKKCEMLKQIILCQEKVAIFVFAVIFEELQTDGTGAETTSSSCTSFFFFLAI